MKYLLSVCALFALLTIGCGEDTVVQNAPVSNSGKVVEVMEVDQDALASAIANNDLTLVKFTATW